MKFKSLILMVSGILAIQIAATSCQAQELKAGFYNVENLFDLVDDPATDDDEFTPNGNLNWTLERYNTKLDHIAEVIDGMGLPDLMGFAEVENRSVVEDLLKQPKLINRGYEIIHHDSPDGRGIDVALIYNGNIFQKQSEEFVAINFPDSLRNNPDLKYSTREILIAHLQKPKALDLFVIVVHAPSRGGGLAATEPLRRYVASKLRSKVDSLTAALPNTGILIMGDFNDEPDNKSISTDLKALSPQNGVTSDNLYNLVYEADQSGLGTYNYRGTWNMLDQFIVNAHLLEQFADWSAQPYKKEKMMYHSDRFGDMPNRTYGGPNYYGGYSDHLPILLTMARR